MQGSGEDHLRGQWQLLLGQVLYDIEGQAGFRILQKEARTKEVHRSVGRAKGLVGMGPREAASVP